jgi:hypothetical protein
MKIAGYILAYYLILLAAVPCCAFDNCPEDKTELAARHETEEDDCGTCSPFFNCEGCSASSIAYEPAPIGIAALKALTVHSVYIQSSLPNIDYDFWQPPKLG